PVVASKNQSRSQTPRHSSLNRRPRDHPPERSQQPPSENRSPSALRSRPYSRYARQSDSPAPERQSTAPPAHSAADAPAAPVPSRPSFTGTHFVGIARQIHPTTPPAYLGLSPFFVPAC